MTNFNVLVVGTHLDDEGLEIVLTSFANLIHDVSPKHRRKIKLTIVDTFDKNPYIYNKAEQKQVEKSMEIVNRSFVNCDDLLENVSILFQPGDNIPIKIISKSLMHSVPILGYNYLRDQNLVDQTCSMLVRHRNKRDTIIEMTHILNVLYFDPEVRKILKRGAGAKYQDSFSWA